MREILGGERQPAATWLAFVPIKRYFQIMSERFRRIATVFLTLTLVMGLMPHGLRAAGAGVQMVQMAMSATGDMPVSGKCDGCGDDKTAMTSAACSAFCASFVALPAIETVFEHPSGDAFGGFDTPALAGHTLSPDPYPPRPAVLS